MDKKEFISLLRSKLKRFNVADIDEAVGYYEELICEKMKEGISEKEAVSSLGNPQELASSIAVDMVARSKTSGINATLILFGALSTPIWLPILIVIIALYFVVFVVWASLFFSFGAVSIASLVQGIGSIFIPGDIATKLLTIGLGLITFVVFAVLCYLIAKYGLKLINLMTIKLAKKVFKRRQEK